ncbi:hypothetical protein VNO77_37146 [Canavalia gladiata]|uniref:Uncharacterized protein n=1 Tax=Canavalia gladiata TaxID=3824 RepID=A0AAN9PUN0_CANGL
MFSLLDILVAVNKRRKWRKHLRWGNTMVNLLLLPNVGLQGPQGTLVDDLCKLFLKEAAQFMLLSEILQKSSSTEEKKEGKRETIVDLSHQERN